MSEQQEHFENINDSDEGAKICKILESAAEPEVIMAEMSSEQLVSFSSYQAKKNVCSCVLLSYCFIFFLFLFLFLCKFFLKTFQGGVLFYPFLKWSI